MTTTTGTNLHDRYRAMIHTYGEAGFEKIRNAKLLVVGAGGIGCEILKNLALAGYRYVDLIDLDTIDVSNLNRQFLFRPEHVGQAKSIIAAQAAKRFNAELQVTAYHDNIKNPQFNINYFSQFDVVLNALDNVDARRHVNRLCLAAKVPLFDSGTTGYLGQVMPILKGYTACYECFPKPTQKVYPICTIRSTPDKPVHCIVWAKECLKLLFGPTHDSMLFEDEEASGEKSTYMSLIKIDVEKELRSIGDRTARLEHVLAFCKTLLIALFHTEIQKRIDMNVYKTAKITPVPLSLEVIEEGVELARKELSSTPVALSSTSASDWNFKMWSLSQDIVEFVHAYVEIIEEEITTGQSVFGKMSFDKDDDWSMRFVTASSNLRSHIFTIPTLSFHDAKGIAGNIIPAIATTNAIIAGAQVQQATKLITSFTKQELFNSANGENTTETFKQRILTLFPHCYCLRYPTRKGVYLQPSSSDPPVNACYVCGKSELTLQIDVSETTLEELVTKVIKAKLGFNEPMISVGSNILYEEGGDCDEDMKDNLPLKLTSCPGGGIHDGTVLSISDFTQDLEMTLVIRNCSKEELSKQESSAVDLFILEGQQAFEQRMKANAEAAATTAASASEGSSSSSSSSKSAVVETDDIVLIVDAAEVTKDSKKRKHEEVEVVDEDVVEIVDGKKSK